MGKKLGISEIFEDGIYDDSGELALEVPDEPIEITRTAINSLIRKFNFDSQEAFAVLNFVFDKNADGKIDEKDDLNKDGIIKKDEGEVGEHSQFEYDAKALVDKAIEYFSYEYPAGKTKDTLFPIKKEKTSKENENITNVEILDESDISEKEMSVETLNDWLIGISITTGTLLLIAVGFLYKRKNNEKDLEKHAQKLQKELKDAKNEIERLNRIEPSLNEKLKNIEQVFESRRLSEINTIEATKQAEIKKLKIKIQLLEDQLEAFENKHGIKKLKDDLKKAFEDEKQRLRNEWNKMSVSTKESAAVALTKALESLEEQEIIVQEALKALDLSTDPGSIPIVFDSSKIKKTENQILEMIDSFKQDENGDLLVENPIFVMAEKMYQQFKKEHEQRNFVLAFILVLQAKGAFKSAQVFEKYVLENVNGEEDFAEDMTEAQKEVVQDLRARRKGHWLEGDDDQLLNFYEILGLDNLETDINTIKGAYRAYSKKYHPDMGSEKNDEKFKKGNLANDVIANGEKEFYDECLKKFYNL